MPSAPFNFALTLAAAAATLPGAPALSAAPPPAATRVYFGTYDSDLSQGIYVASWNPETGALGEVKLAAKTKSPSFLALTPDRKHIVAVNENGTEAHPDGAVSSWKINPANGLLSPLGEQPSQGGAPCHVAISPDSRTAVIANYGGGSFASYRLGEDGKLSAPVTFVQNKGHSLLPRQSAPHAHSGTFSPDGQFAYFCDLGLDTIFARRLVPATSALDPLDVPNATVKAGSGPRHFAFHPTLPVAYVINEIASTVTTLTYDAKSGALNPVQSASTLPAGQGGDAAKNSTAHITVHPNGKWVYGSNRGHDSIARFTVDASTGWLRLAEATPSGGKTPRNFSLDPTGTWLLAAHQDSDSVAVHALDPATGALKPTEGMVKVGRPVCVVFY